MTSPGDLPVLEVTDLDVGFRTPHGHVPVLHGVSLCLRPGQVLGIVGEAGSGKTVLVRALLRLLPDSGRITGGTVAYRGDDLVGMADHRLGQLRATHISQILADAKSQLNPLVRIGEFMVDVFRAHRKASKKEATAAAAELLRSVGITDPERRLDAYPHELSGGMAQRICIALALMHGPEVIIADEPTAGLDVTVQRQVLDLMASLLAERDAAQLIVTRDLGIVAQYCHEVAVLHQGQIVETAATEELFDNPCHPYTRRFLQDSGTTSRPGSRAAAL